MQYLKFNFTVKHSISKTEYTYSLGRLLSRPVLWNQTQVITLTFTSIT